MNAPLPDLAAPITAVTVFRANRALVTRSAPLPPGKPGLLRFSDLPLALADATLRVRIAGSPAVASDLAVTIAGAGAEAALTPAEDPELRAAQRAESLAAAELACAEAHRKRLDAISPLARAHGPRGTPPPPSPTAARLALIDFQQDELARAAAACVRLRDNLRLAIQTRAAAQARVDATSTARNARTGQARKTVIVTLLWPDAATADDTTGTIHLDYLIPGARWTPACAIRLDRPSAKAAITMRAAVAQRTGEDWHQARLTLSTADAQEWHRLPELASLRIGRRQTTAPKPGYRPAPEGADALFADYLEALRAEQAVQDAIRAEESRASFGSRAAAGGAPAAARAEEPQKELAGPAVGAAPPPAVSRAPDQEKRQKKTAGSMGGELVMFDDAGPAEVLLDSAPSGRSKGNSRRVIASKPAAPGGTARMRRNVDESNLLGEHEGGGGFGGQVKEESAAIRLDLRQADLDYRALHLQSPDRGGRGNLSALTVIERYQHRRVTIDTATVVRLIAQAEHEAEALSSLPKPAHCHDPITPRFAYAYPAEIPADVPADGAWHTIPLHAATAATTLDHVVVPRESRDVFRLLTFANPFDAPLLAGPADVYSGDDYLMTTDLAFTLPGGQVALGLGVEPAISVARNTTYEESSAGLLGGTTVHTHRIAITIANKLTEAVALDIRERLPVAAHGVDDLKVKILSVTPAWEDYPHDPAASAATANGGEHPAAHPDHERLEGGHRWRVDLPPATNRDLVATYTITIPARQEVVGGNRREG
jgi:hypothetical protein